jgi:hypothetical protein
MRAVLCALLVALAAAGAALASPTETVSAKGLWLARQLDDMDVESKWIAGVHVDWRSGLPDGRPESGSGRHTHCSAFVAAVAARLGVYILRPPEHGQVLLAYAQAEWLDEEGEARGWRSLPDAEAAQAAANRGELVVAAYENHRSDKPGHIAIIRPSARSAAELAAKGPLVVQAGAVNSPAISLREGFSGHPAAWRDHEARFYAHALKDD